MKRLILLGLVLALVSFAAVSVPAAIEVQASVHQTFTVGVGYENASNGTLIEAFLPDTVYVHPGDKVHWVIKTHEIHTVTFLYGNVPAGLSNFLIPAPGGAVSPLMINPDDAFPTVPTNGIFDGSSFANSGVISLDPGNSTSLDLTFTKVGTYTYLCEVHGPVMSGKVVVLPADKRIPSPGQSAWMGQKQLGDLLELVPGVFKQAEHMVTPPSRNKDGSKTYHVMVGFGKGQIDLVHFFPTKLNVHQGDTVEWDMPMVMPNMGLPPHTVSFLNGTPDQPLVVVDTTTVPGKTLLLFNPGILFPTGQTMLTKSGYFNSGVLDATGQQGAKSYSLKIGAISGWITYQCLIHDGSGMVGQLNVVNH